MAAQASTFRRAGLAGLCVVFALALTAALLTGLDHARRALAATASPADLGSWENAGVYGGAVFNVVFDASGRIYIAVNSIPGLYYSDSSGDVWVPIPRYDERGTEVLVHETGGVYALLTSALLHSSDGGSTWTTLAESNQEPFTGQLYDFDVQRENPDHMVIGLSPNSYDPSALVSWDGGATWLPSTLPFSPDFRTIRTVFDPSHPQGNIVYALVGNTLDAWAGNFILQSQDGGLSYTPVFTTAPGVMVSEIAVTPLGTVLAGTGTGVYRSTDMINWQLVLSGTNSNILRVGTGNPVPIFTFMHISYDDGLTWQDTPYGGVLAQSPADPDFMLRASMFGLERTTDGGLTWVETVQGIEGIEARKVGTDPFDNQILYFTSYPAAGRSLDGGRTWKFPLTDFTLTGWGLGIDPTQSGTLYIGDYPGLVYKSSDYGTTWDPPTWIDPNHETSVFDLAVDPGDNQRVYAATMGSDPATLATTGGVYYSPDGGATWNPTSIHNVQANTVRVGSTIGGSIAYAGVGDGQRPTTLDGIHRSTDGGATWTKLPLADQAISTIAVDPTDARTVLASFCPPAAQPPSCLYRSLDAGQTWQPLPFYQYANEIILDPENPHILFLLAGGTIFKSSDGGNSFITFYIAAPGEQLTSLFIPFLPPSPPSGLGAAQVEGSLVLTWTNPIDPDFAGVSVRVLTDTFPTAHTLGLSLTVELGEPGAAGVFTHTGVLSDTTYYYSLFAFDDEEHFSSPATISATLGSSLDRSGAQALAGSLAAGPVDQLVYLTTSNGIYRYSESSAGERRVYLPLIPVGR